MKIGLISDLHIDHNSRMDVVPAFLSVVKDRGFDALTIAGDISSSISRTTSFVQLAEQSLGIPIYYVLGNHEYYSFPETETHTAQWIRNSSTLFGQPVILGDYGIIMDTGWYDFTWKAIGKLDRTRKGKTSHGTWSDFRFIQTEGEENFAEWLTEQAVQNMTAQNAALDKLGIKKKIVMMHMVPHYRFLRSEFEYMETNVFFWKRAHQRSCQSNRARVLLFRAHSLSTRPY